MDGATFTSAPLATPGRGAHRLAVTCAHAMTEFLYHPAGLPPVLQLSEAEAARLVLIRHAAAAHCRCTAALSSHPAHSR